MLYSNQENYSDLSFTSILGDIDENNSIKIDGQKYYTFIDNSDSGDFKVAILMPVNIMMGVTLWSAR